jgi:hypothetical protein
MAQRPSPPVTHEGNTGAPPTRATHVGNQLVQQPQWHNFPLEKAYTNDALDSTGLA